MKNKLFRFQHGAFSDVISIINDKYHSSYKVFFQLERAKSKRFLLISLSYDEIQERKVQSLKDS
jgi:hypothetical protein